MKAWTALAWQSERPAGGEGKVMLGVAENVTSKVPLASNTSACCLPRFTVRVVTDTLEAQAQMREHVRGVGFALMIATALHAIATGNLLPAWVRVACVDINPATVTKLTDRGSIQTVGVVTDAEPFLRALVHELKV